MILISHRGNLNGPQPENENSPEKEGPCAGEDQSSLLQPAVADVGCVWRILHH